MDLRVPVMAWKTRMSGPAAKIRGNGAAVAIRREEVAKAGPSQVGEALKSLNPDDITPREALEALYALKKQLGKA